MTRFLELLLVASVTLGVFSAFAPNIEEPDFEQVEFDDDKPFGTLDDIEALRTERYFLLEEINRLKQLNDDLKSDMMSLEGEPVERLHGNITLLQRPHDCADLMMSGVTESGIYDIYPFSCQCGSAIRVYCDMETDGGGWTVILSRMSQEPEAILSRMSLDFNRTWEEYKDGFGTPDMEHWMGNEKMHLLTSSRSYALRLDLTTTAGDTQKLIYDSFRVDDENSKYTLRLGSRTPESTTTYDCFSYMNNRAFSTYDRDFDSSTSENCAVKYGGGFWYSYYSTCYYSPPTSIYDGHLNFTCYRSNNQVYQVSSLQMKIRPTVCDTTYKRIHLLNSECGGECGEPVPHIY